MCLYISMSLVFVGRVCSWVICVRRRAAGEEADIACNVMCIYMIMYVYIYVCVYVYIYIVRNMWMAVEESSRLRGHLCP